ncbi:MAG: AMP-binding protein, partial [Gemmatimonadaceae bacterium]
VGAVETTLAELWTELLHVDRVSRYDDFFALGGHSLIAVTLIERMRRRNLTADIRTLFASPMLAALAAAVRGARDAKPREVVVPPIGIPFASTTITPEMLSLVQLTQFEIDAVVATVRGGAANVQDIYPLAPLQDGILFHHLLASDGDPYLLAGMVAFDTRERLDAYLAAMQAVIDRHDILRTAVVWERVREPVQVVWRTAPLEVEEVAFDSTLGPAAVQLAARFDPRRMRIDVRSAPMIRGYVAWDPQEAERGAAGASSRANGVPTSTGNGRWMLLLLQHHLVGDHTAFDVMHEEITAHLAGTADRLAAPQPFRNFIAQARLGVTQEEHEAFFREMLGDVAEPSAPFGLLDVQGDGASMRHASARVPTVIAYRLRARARALRVSVATICHVAWAQVLARVSGRGDVVFGTVLFGRMQGGEGADRAMGLFINTLPVRIRVDDTSAEAAVRRAHELLAEILQHEHASLALAQRCSGVAAPTPLFSALLNYRHVNPLSKRKNADDTPARRGAGHVTVEERSNYPIDLSVDDFGDELGLVAQTASSVEPERVCELMLTALARLADALDAAPATPLRALDVMPVAERRQVVEDWNATDAPIPNVCLHDLVAVQAARTPGATAVVSGSIDVTYAEIEKRATALAAFLRVRYGVGPETRVALCLERSVELIVGMLAVLQAGGAFVPLDPEHPAERLRFLLADSAPALVLTGAAGLRPEVAADLTIPLVSVHTEAPIDDAPSAARRQAMLPTQLAYVIYTSGSTGKPKGVGVSHEAAVAQLTWVQRAFGLTPADRMLQFAAPTFDIAIEEIFGPLVSGATVVLRTDAWLESADVFWAACA